MMNMEQLDGKQIGQEVVINKGETLFQEGDAGHHMYIVLAGTVEIWLEIEGKQIPAAKLGEGDFFGEMSLLEGLPRSGTAKAAEPCRLLLLQEEAFRELLSADSAFAWRIMKALSSRVRELVQRVGKDLQEVAEQLDTNTQGVVAGIEAIAKSASEIEWNEKQLAEEIKDVQHISKQIGSIMSFIRTVSTQTHILGLNAGIEAARSGEHGRGFAVIAEEIRKLSAQSKENAEQIANLIEQIGLKMTSITLASEGSAIRSHEQASATNQMAAATSLMTELAARLSDIAASMKS
ncbi:methyl-accepting chemotaxis protein [Paenibacillus alba]|uniref:Methyl-accepting chemotaxis protein n=1 Tax=Paenibacillus alba TaxID=1197127 RepID=A0ABU6GAS7_9BACL|nr:methyl-accepting chemotaxis protein [Paenibacillus alba]MEC0230367.1 methyl-accepting chemotaxis protein [Paenibacillus alba]